MITSARRAHAIVLAVFATCGVIQVFLAGLGVFADPEAFVSHREFGYLFGWLTLVALVLALAGRLPRRLIGAGVLLLALFALQSVLVALRADMPVVAALHPVNGFAIIGLAVATARASWRIRDEGAPASVAAADLGAPARSGVE